MLRTRAHKWPAQADCLMKPEWDGFRLLVAVDDERRTRAWSRLGTSLGDRIGTLLDPLSDAPKRSIFDAELVALSSRDRSAIQDFGAVCRARAPRPTPRRSRSCN